MPEQTPLNGEIIAGVCFVCGGELICSADGNTLHCKSCGIRLKVQRAEPADTKPAADTPVAEEESQPQAPAEAPTEAPAVPNEPEEIDEEVVALAATLAETPGSPISNKQMSALTLANHATQLAALPHILPLASTALEGRKFRRAIPLYTIVNTVSPSAEHALAVMLAKAGCTSLGEIPASDVELTTMAEYPAFLKIADEETRTEFLRNVRLQAERKEEAEENRMEEERLAYIAVQQHKLRWTSPFCYTAVILALLSFGGILALAIGGMYFGAARFLFALTILFSLASIGLFVRSSLLIRNIQHAEDMDSDHRTVLLVTASAIFLCILAALTLFFSGISGGYDGRANGFYYTELSNGIAVSAPQTDATTLVIPETLHGKTVVKISDFSGSTTLQKVTLPDTVIEVEQFAFAGCYRLTEIALPETLAIMGGGVFKDCVSLKQITIPRNIAALEGYLFSGCTSLQTVTFANGSGLTTIATNAFAGCISLTEMSFPSSLALIADNAFYGCTAFTGFTGGHGLVSIGNRAFYGCSSLYNLAFSDGLTSIGVSAFENCTSLILVTTPVSIRNIGAYAFRGCINLVDVIIPTGSATLGTGVFNGCEKLEQIYTPETPAEKFTYTIANNEVTITGYIGEDLIVSVPSAIQEMPVVAIGSRAFHGMRQLTNVTLPNSVLFIGESAFEDCTALVSVRFGTDLQEISIAAFKNCNALSSLALDHCTSLLLIREQAFLDCWELAEIQFAPNLQIIQDYAFEDCRKLTTVSLPNSLTELCHAAFRGCASLRKVEIGTGAIQIYPLAFYGCTVLKSITIPVNATLVTEILNGELVSPFTGWNSDQGIFVRYPKPEDFPGFGPGCKATESWGI